MNVVQAAAPAAEKLLTHAEHCKLPVAAKVPAAHCAHDVSEVTEQVPVAVGALPAAHCVHGMQVAAPAAAEKKPTAHCAQAAGLPAE